MPETRYWYGLQPNLPVKSPTRFPEDPEVYAQAPNRRARKIGRGIRNRGGAMTREARHAFRAPKLSVVDIVHHPNHAPGDPYLACFLGEGIPILEVLKDVAIDAVLGQRRCEHPHRVQKLVHGKPCGNLDVTEYVVRHRGGGAAAMQRVRLQTQGAPCMRSPSPPRQEQFVSLQTS